MTKAKTKIYTALTLVWSSKANKFVYPGEQIELDHLPAEDIKRLVDNGVIELVTQPVTSEEMTNG